MAVRRLCITLFALGGLIWISVAVAQTTSSVYLPTLEVPIPTNTPTIAPTASTAPSPIVSPTATTKPLSNKPWRQPGAPHVRLSVVDVEQLDTSSSFVSVRNDTDRTMFPVIVTKAVFNDDGTVRSELSMQYSYRLVPGEVRRFYLSTAPGRLPASEIQAFGLPAS